MLMLKNADVLVQAFVDDLLLQGKITKEMQEALNLIITALDIKKFFIIRSKSEYLSDEDDKIINPASNEIIPKKAYGKYLGQMVNNWRSSET